MFKRILTLGLCGVLGYLVAVGALQVASAWGLSTDRETENAAARVREVMLLVNKDSVEPDKVKGEELAARAIAGVIQPLDRYTEYLGPEAYHQLEEDLGNSFGGIGVQVEQVEDRVVVVAPIAGGPGERAGMLRGDVLEKVDGESMTGKKLVELVTRLRGKPGTLVVLTVLRGGRGAGVAQAGGPVASGAEAAAPVPASAPPAREIKFSLRREVIRVDSVRDVELLPDGVGYLRLTQFGERTGAEFAKALTDLKTRGMRGLVIDLRNNPGGLIRAAEAVAEPFFERGELVVYTQGRREEQREEYRAKGGGVRLAVPMAVLVNGGSASAAEIVTGALKDTHRAVIVGEKTFGKGSVQTIFPLHGNAALRLTTARYYTPSGVVIHEKGIEPDLKVTMSPEQEKAVFLRRLRPDVKDAVEFKAKFGVEPAADSQLEAALAAVREKLGERGSADKAPVEAAK
jgi:carboxyl-terminal processing protease